MIKEKTTAEAGYTPEQLHAWKEKWGRDNIRLLKLPTDELRTNEIECVGRVPDRVVIGEFMKYSDKDPVKANTILVKNCILTKKEEVLADEFLFNTAVSTLADMIPIGKGTIVKI